MPAAATSVGWESQPSADGRGGAQPPVVVMVLDQAAEVPSRVLGRVRSGSWSVNDHGSWVGGDLTDEQWVTLEALLPKGRKAGRPPVWPRRQLIDGIRFRARTGVPLRDVPVGYGPWSRVYDLFRRWQRNGTWHRTLTRLQSLADAKGAILWDLSVDSTVCRAHQHVPGARKQGDLQREPPGGLFTELPDHGLGRSRGGFTTKLHLAVEQGQKPMSIVVTAGQRGDSPQFEPVLAKVRVPRIGPGRPGSDLQRW
ncbi:IS5 family transposase [Streptomyces parvus]|uniref:IS5 family transposase n=1 Tax=Streptomyces parvus TaxID=66428 RepID=UPI003658B806